MIIIKHYSALVDNDILEMQEYSPSLLRMSVHQPTFVEHDVVLEKF